MKNSIEIIDCGLLQTILNYSAEAYAADGEEAIQEIMNLFQLSRVTMLMRTNRLQSLYLCEMLQSYSIQSQRYNRYDGDLNTDCIFNNLEYFTKGEEEAIADIIKKCSELYLEMTELKEESKNKSKYTIDDFKYGIPVEDARFILPTAFSCNKEVTFEGLSILGLFKLFKCERGIFPNMYEMLMDEVIRFLNTSDQGKLSADGESFMRKIIELLVELTPYTNRVGSERFFNVLGERENIEDINLLKDSINKESSMHKTGAAALMCTSTGDINDIYCSKSEEEFKHITERVAGGQHHMSILNHVTYSLLMKMSVPCYNQYVRHIHQQCIREDFHLDMLPYFIVPSSVSESPFLERFLELHVELCKVIQKLTENTENDTSASELSEIRRKYRMDAIKQLYPMGVELRVVCVTNLQNELKNKFPKRLCNKAQWEMRNVTRGVYSLVSNDIGNDNELLNDAKPGCCTKNGCPEGRGHCKDNSDVIKIFKK